MVSDDDTALEPGTVLRDRYLLHTLIGKGAMGTVYKAFDRELGDVCAIKVLKTPLSNEQRARQRFLREISLAITVTHPNVCRVFHFDRDRDTPFIVMEFIEGSDLKQRLGSPSSGLPPADTLSIAIQVAEGLRAIHEANVVHRDLKPANIFLPRTGGAKVMDFGIAKAAGGRASPTVTESGALVGTPQYMSPEQARGGTVDCRSDLYALGVVCFEMLTGQAPFQGEHVIDVLRKQMDDPPPLAHGKLPVSWVPVLAKTLAKEPAERYQGCSELLEALRGLELPATPTQPDLDAGVRVQHTASGATARALSLFDSVVERIRRLDASISIEEHGEHGIPLIGELGRFLNELKVRGSSFAAVSAPVGSTRTGEPVRLFLVRFSSDTEAVVALWMFRPGYRTFPLLFCFDAADQMWKDQQGNAVSAADAADRLVCTFVVGANLAQQ